MQRVRGFTLLELMVVVAVIAILAGIAYPLFSEQMRKGKRSEAIAAISDIQLRQERWRSNNATYGNLTGADFAAGNIFGSVAAVTGYNSGLKNYNISVSNNTGTGYIVTATRKNSMANDPRCGNFIMTYSAGTSSPSVSSGDRDYCWRRQ